MSRRLKRFFVGLWVLGGLIYAPHIPAPFVADDHFIFWRLREQDGRFVPVGTLLTTSTRPQ